MTYKITYKEVLLHTFEVEANSHKEAEKEFERLADAGEIDFSDGEVIDTETIIQPAETDEQNELCNLPTNCRRNDIVT